MNLISLGKFQKHKKELSYDKLFHLALIINNKWLLEKNHVVRAVQTHKVDQGEVLNVPIPHNVIITHFIADGIKAQSDVTGTKDSFWEYSASKANCQSFCFYLLKGSVFDSAKTREFIVQDAKQLLRGIHGTEILTDIAGIGSALTGLF